MLSGFVDKFEMELLDNRSVLGGDNFKEIQTDPRELSCDTKHLPKVVQDTFNNLKQSYNALFSRHKHDIGTY